MKNSIVSMSLVTLFTCSLVGMEGQAQDEEVSVADIMKRTTCVTSGPDLWWVRDADNPECPEIMWNPQKLYFQANDLASLAGLSDLVKIIEEKKSPYGVAHLYTGVSKIRELKPEHLAGVNPEVFWLTLSQKFTGFRPGTFSNMTKLTMLHVEYPHEKNVAALASAIQYDVKRVAPNARVSVSCR